MTEYGVKGSHDAHPRSRTFRVALTGGIASGKSTVADLFAGLGVPVIDTDVVAREVVAPGMPALEEIRKAFGDEVLTDAGELDRAAMRRIIFADSDRRHELEAILHPRIREASMQQAEAADGPYQLIVVPLLVGSPMRDNMDRVLVVDVPESVQRERLMARDGSNKRAAQRMIDAQASREERLAIADDVITNTGPEEELGDRVAALHQRYRELAGEQPA